jgi:hypothetical protein
MKSVVTINSLFSEPLKGGFGILVNPFYFDYRFFEKILIDEARSAFALLREQAIDEAVYGYGFYGRWKFEPIYPYILTEARLTTRIESAYRAYPHRYRGLSRQNMRWYLRYAAPEPDECSVVQHLKLTHQELYDGQRMFRGLYLSTAQELGYGAADQLNDEHQIKYEHSCMRVLRTLDMEGVFGQGEARQQVIVLLWQGRAEPDWNHCVELNPTQVIQRYRIEVAKASGLQRIVWSNQGVSE